ncbi:GTPase Era [Derxia lacustris]|uniref:GTPase Era n=1 Tax=Derxia lacustris TaxID=764842 RepID=UPI000A175343|nr:GTPase Era [Derxia lacustris]
MNQEVSSASRAGHVAIVGRPNVGKSTLLNALVGQKVSITADKAQTTRHRILGIDTQPGVQFVFVDTPGYQTKHSNALNRVLNRAVTSALSDIDCVLWVIEALRCGPEDRKLLSLLPADKPVILVLNKVDRVERKNDLLPFVAEVSKLRDFAAVVPVSATKPIQLDVLRAETAKLLPLGEPMYAEDEVTDRSMRFMAAELIREKVFRLIGDELPYESTVVIEKFDETTQPGRIEVHANLLVASESQRAIMIGAGGERIKRIGTEARKGMEAMFERGVHLELWVKVKSGWADNEAGLRAYGYD